MIKKYRSQYATQLNQEVSDKSTQINLMLLKYLRKTYKLAVEAFFDNCNPYLCFKVLIRTLVYLGNWEKKYDFFL